MIRSIDGPHYEGFSNVRKVNLRKTDLNVSEVIETIHNDNDNFEEKELDENLNNIINRIEDSDMEKNHSK